MKKILLVLFLILICTTGCSSQKESIHDMVNNFEEITMEIKEGTVSNTGVTVAIRNNSGNGCTFGESYQVEKKLTIYGINFPVKKMPPFFF